MSDDELLASASKAAGEPVGQGPSDPELEHAMAVLRAATVPPDAQRRARVQEAVDPPAPIIPLWAFAAATAACFMVGIFVLVTVALAPPQQPIARTPDEPNLVKPGDDSDGGTPGEVEQPYERPAWVTEQADRLAARGGGVRGASAGPRAGSPRGSADPHAAEAAKVDFAVYRFADLPDRLPLTKAKAVPASETDTGFDVFTVEYERPGSVVLVVQAAATAAARRAFEPEGLQGNAVLMEQEGTLLLLLSNTLSSDELLAAAKDLARIK